MKFLWLAAAIVTLLVGGAGATAQTTGPFFMFKTANFSSFPDGAQALATLETYTTPNDYLGVGLAISDEILYETVDRSHQFSLPVSEANIAKTLSIGCWNLTPGMLIYDPENTNGAPLRELENMPRSVGEVSQLVTGSCDAVGVGPGPGYVGLKNDCTLDPIDFDPPGRLNIVEHPTDWTGITLVVIQSQSLLQCLKPNRFDLLRQGLMTTANILHRDAPNLKVVAQFTFKYSSPADIIQAISLTYGFVDGYYLAYPANPVGTCTYCTAANLAQVLSYIRSLDTTP